MENYFDSGLEFSLIGVGATSGMWRLIMMIGCCIVEFLYFLYNHRPRVNAAEKQGLTYAKSRKQKTKQSEEFTWRT